jgi:6-phosphogluconolactonase (cycloisomerase 2 family)
MSPRVSALQVDPLKRLSTLELPMSSQVESHPHQVVQHPRLSNRFYVPDLGANKVHEIEMVWEGPRPELAYRRSVDVDRSCVGPRHAVFSESKAGERCSCVTPGYVN